MENVQQPSHEAEPPDVAPTPRELAWCESCMALGIEIGRRQVEAEQAAVWARTRETVQRVASSPSFAERAERHGDHERAARARQRASQRGAVQL